MPAGWMSTMPTSSSAMSEVSEEARASSVFRYTVQIHHPQEAESSGKNGASRHVEPGMFEEDCQTCYKHGQHDQQQTKHAVRQRLRVVGMREEAVTPPKNIGAGPQGRLRLYFGDGNGQISFEKGA